MSAALSFNEERSRIMEMRGHAPLCRRISGHRVHAYSSLVGKEEEGSNDDKSPSSPPADVTRPILPDGAQNGGIW